MRSMSASLSSLINDISEINKKEPQNELIGSMRSMMLHCHSLLIKYRRLIKKYW